MAALPRELGTRPTRGPAVSDEWWLWGLVAAVACVKVAAVLLLANHPLLQPRGGLDSEAYVTLARGISSGAAVPDSAFYVSPLYLYFLAGIFTFTGGSLLAARLCQAMLGTLAVWLIYRTGRSWGDHRIGIIAAGLAGLTGLFTFYEAMLLQAALDPLLAALVLWVMTRAFRRTSGAWWLAAGVVQGLYALNRPNVVMVSAVLIVWVLAAGRNRMALRRASLLAVGLAAAIAPATWHNYRATGEFIPISSHGGLNFYIGNNPMADGTYRAVPGVTPSIIGQARDVQVAAERAAGRSLSTREASGYFTGLAWAWIEARPREALTLLMRKLRYVWNAAFLPLTHSYPYYVYDEVNPLRLLIVGPWLLLPLGCLALLLPAAPWADGGYRATVLFALAYAVSVAVFFVSARYRLPLLVPLCLMAGVAGDWLVKRWRRGPRRYAVSASVALIVLGVATNWPTGLDNGRSEERAAMLLWLVDNGRSDEALRRLSAFEASDPQPARLLLRLGQAFDEQQRAAQAVPLLERALALDPGHTETRLVLGQALIDAGRPGDAIPHLQAAMAAGRGAPAAAEVALVQALAAAGRPREAAARLERLAALPDLEVHDLVVVSDLAMHVRSDDLALRVIDRAITQQPRVALLREKRGLALVMLGRPAEARAELEEARRLDPRSASICLNLAVLEAQEGRLEVARTLARAALQLRPDYQQAKGLLATLDGKR